MMKKVNKNSAWFWYRQFRDIFFPETKVESKINLTFVIDTDFHDNSDEVRKNFPVESHRMLQMKLLLMMVRKTISAVLKLYKLLFN